MFKERLPKIPFPVLRKTFMGVIFASIFFAGGYLFGLNGYQISLNKYPHVNITRGVPPDKETLDFNLFWRVWDTLHAKYFDKNKVIDSELTYGAIRGMVAAVGDPYTVFLTPKENKVVQEDLQGSFEGVGIQIGFRGTQLAVMAPLPESPAEKAGIKAGDYIMVIKDEAKDLEIGTVGITLQEAVEAIRGPKNTTVNLTLLREGQDEPFTVDIKREAIDVPSLTIEYLEEDKSIAHVKLIKFAGETFDEWDETVAEIVKNPGVKSIIFDLRNNPGGYLQAAVELASDFLNTGDIVVIEEDYTGKKEEFKVEKLGRLKNMKLVVLVNKGSASASEIFAGAIKDHERGKIVGDTTFGKGTIQEPQQINGGSGLHITIARWLTPKSIWLNETGLKPDVEVEDKSDTEEDEQLQKAIEVVKS